MEIAYLSDLGKMRKNNEDYVGKFVNKAGAVMVIVADGLGGHNGGEVASEMAVPHLGYYFSETSFFSISQASTWLSKKVDEENSLILKNSLHYKDLRGMGTTLVVAIIFEQEFLLAHIGDSRGYILEKGNLTRVTEDHSLVNELIKEGELSPEEAEHHPKKNIITRSLGISKNSELDEEFFQITKNSILMLCTDGLTNMVEDTKLERLLNISESLPDKCQRLVDEANRAGGNDNISVLLVSFDEEVKY